MFYSILQDFLVRPIPELMTSKVESSDRHKRFEGILKRKKSKDQHPIPGFPSWLQYSFNKFTDSLKAPSSSLLPKYSDNLDVLDEKMTSKEAPGVAFTFTVVLIQKVFMSLSNPQSINLQSFRNLRDSSEAFRKMLTLPIKPNDTEYTP